MRKVMNKIESVELLLEKHSAAKLPQRELRARLGEMQRKQVRGGGQGGGGCSAIREGLGGQGS